MAISDSFNLNNAINSQTYAYKCWYNYNYAGNTMGISGKDIGKITQAWSGELTNWQAIALNDENAYEISDDDFSTAKLNGKAQGEEVTDGKGGKNAGNITSVVGSAAGSLAGGVAAGVSGLSAKIGANIGAKAGVKAGQQLGSELAAQAGQEIIDVAAGKTCQDIAMETGKQLGQKAGEEVGKEAGEKIGKVSAYVAAGIAIVTAAAYWVRKPNKDEKEACDALQGEMANAQSALSAAQGDMDTYRGEIEELSDEAQGLNEEANGSIEDDKSEYDVYYQSYKALMEKVQSGEPLTEEEKAFLQELMGILSELGINIQTTQSETIDESADIYDTMEDYQDGFDNSAETIGEVEGLTDYAESFDKLTRTMCYVEAGSQSLNAASAGIAAAKLMAGPWWNWVIAALAVGAGASSVAAAAQQFKYAGAIGNEIDARELTQDVNTETLDIYDESISDYEGQMGIVEDLEIVMPKDLENPEEAVATMEEESATALATPSADPNNPTTTNNGFGVITTNNGNNTNNNTRGVANTPSSTANTGNNTGGFGTITTNNNTQNSPSTTDSNSQDDKDPNKKDKKA